MAGDLLLSALKGSESSHATTFISCFIAGPDYVGSCEAMLVFNCPNITKFEAYPRLNWIVSAYWRDEKALSLIQPNLSIGTDLSITEIFLDWKDSKVDSPP